MPSEAMWVREMKAFTVIAASFFRYFIIVSTFLVFAAALSRSFEHAPFIGVAKQGVLILFSLTAVICAGHLAGASLAIFGYFIFLFFGAFFTLPSDFNLTTLFNIFGYILLFLLYCAFGARNSRRFFEEIVNVLVWISPIFLLINGISMGDSDAYTYGKHQFQGVFYNPNPFSAFCSVLLIACVWRGFVAPGRRLERLLCLVSVLGLVVMLLMSFSRAAILATSIGLFLMPFSTRLKVAVGVVFSFVAVSYFLVGVGPDDIVVQRDVMEESGRVQILENYIAKLNEYYWVFGTGFSLDGDRIKSELSYFDVWLSTGVGFLGFGVFWLVAIVASFRVRKVGYGGLASTLLFFVLTLSLFEGYLANVSSIITVLAYVVAGVVTRLGREVESKRLLSSESSLA
ncbi:O-antigen ligase family protein [Microbulbifer pacificus]|uniref:O-antigen ligase like membrane protein n=1 Tax=Microbulbifer pacificus TaxID=407164 RepID=A0AAU0MZJ5_9GAMM|nr:hypothetical protein [Microbulbifer pacificus]WOX05441.1 hypothetical protein R5R33_17135 [Microbulbifer pacificus]